MPITIRKRSFRMNERIHLLKVERVVTMSGMPVELFRKNLKLGTVSLEGKYASWVDILARKKEKTLRMESKKSSGRATMTRAAEMALGDLLSVYDERLKTGKMSPNPSQEMDRLKLNIDRLKMIIQEKQGHSTSKEHSTVNALHMGR